MLIIYNEVTFHPNDDKVSELFSRHKPKSVRANWRDKDRKEDRLLL